MKSSGYVHLISTYGENSTEFVDTNQVNFTFYAAPAHLLGSTAAPLPSSVRKKVTSRILRIWLLVCFGQWGALKCEWRVRRGKIRACLHWLSPTLSQCWLSPELGTLLSVLQAEGELWVSCPVFPACFPVPCWPLIPALQSNPLVVLAIPHQDPNRYIQVLGPVRSFLCPVIFLMDKIGSYLYCLSWRVVKRTNNACEFIVS